MQASVWAERGRQQQPHSFGSDNLSQIHTKDKIKTLEVIWGFPGKHAGDASGSGLASLGSRVITKHLNSSFSSSKDDTLFQYSSSFKSQNVFLTFNFLMKNCLDIRRSTAQLIGNRGVITLPGTFNSNITLPGTFNNNITLPGIFNSNITLPGTEKLKLHCQVSMNITL